MSPMLSQVDGASVQVAAWIIAAFGVAGGVNQVLKLVDRTREKPPANETYVRRDWCAGRQAEVDRRLNQLEGDVRKTRDEAKDDLREFNAQAEDRSRRIHQRIDALSQQLTDEVGQLKGVISELRK